jgi:uncharacterized protein YndB with AHSA1/START domain
MKEFRARAVINAVAVDVFRVLTDASCYPQFDANCARVDGTIEHGQRIKIIAKAPKRGINIRITNITPHDMSMTWEFGLPLNLLKRVRTFKVIAKDDQTTEVQLCEVQSGHLCEFFRRRQPDPTLSLQQFARGLKKYIESRP